MVRAEHWATYDSGTFSKEVQSIIIRECGRDLYTEYHVAEMARGTIHSTSIHVLCEGDPRACVQCKQCKPCSLMHIIQAQPPKLVHIPTAITAISGWHCRWEVRGATLPTAAWLLELVNISLVVLASPDIHCSIGTASILLHVCACVDI